MDWHVHSELPMLLASIRIIMSLLLMAALPPSLSQSSPSDYSQCNQPYECGEFRDVYYPFWGENRPRQCGSDDKLQLFCAKENDNGYEGQPKYYTYIEMGSQRFNVVTIEFVTNHYKVNLVPLQVDDGRPNVCSMNFSYSLNEPPFTYNQTVHNITIFYDCSDSYQDNHSLGCGGGGGGGNVVFYNGTEEEVLEHHQNLRKCDHHIQVAAEAVLVKVYGGDEDFGDGVLVSYTLSQDCMRCLETNGSCGSNDRHSFTCYCPDGSNALQCPYHDPPPDNRSQGKSMSLLSPHIFLVQFPTLVMIIQVSSFILPSYAWIKD